MSQYQEQPGYFSISLQSNCMRLLSSNSERSFIISRLQDLLVPQHTSKDFALQIDLLAFSITGHHIKLLAFCTASLAATRLADALRESIDWYRSEFQAHGRTCVQYIFTTVSKLRGPHHALEYSIALHLEHEDWGFDRYSSVGFYLHDRRGSWMRLWRMATLYEHNPEYYRRLIMAKRRLLKSRLLATS